VIVTALGDPGALVGRAHDAGAVVVHMVHSVAQAYQAAERGVDVIIAAGGEAGGNSGRVATMILVPQVVDAVAPIPVIASGGIADGRGIAAALLLGAEGVNLGTRFLAAAEAPIAEEWKQVIVGAASEDAVQAEFWNDVRNRPHYDVALRALRTPFSDHWAARRAELADHAEALRAEVSAATPTRMHEYFPMAGQSVGLIREVKPAEVILRELVAEATAALRRAPTLIA
jgi:nitronate monooxygenase/enoyl-[acyl-carrier protein] reductase II